VPGNPGLGEESYARVRKWALSEGSAWRTAYAAAPAEACQASSGLCAAAAGSPDLAKLLVATSPADYDARSSAIVPAPAAAQQQQSCRSSTAAALTLAAEAAVASALQRDAAAVAANISLSAQDVAFCGGSDGQQQRACAEPRGLTAALDRLVNGSIVTAACLPGAAADPANATGASPSCEYRCREQPAQVAGGRFRLVPVRSPYEAQRQIRHAGAFVTRFNVQSDFADWLAANKANPAAVYECANGTAAATEAHAVPVVGYSNTEGYWVVQNRCVVDVLGAPASLTDAGSLANQQPRAPRATRRLTWLCAAHHCYSRPCSWAPGAGGDAAFFRVKFGVCGMLAAGDTVGLSFTPAQPLMLPVTGPVSDPTNGTRSCFNFTVTSRGQQHGHSTPGTPGTAVWQWHLVLTLCVCATCICCAGKSR
jgi:hypothetical protein